MLTLWSILLKLNPGLKGWAAIIFLVAVSAFFFKYGHDKYHEGKADAIREYQETSQKLLERDLGAIKERLSEAIAQREKSYQRARELEITLSEYNKRSEGYEKTIKELANRNEPCDRIDPDWYRVFQQLHKGLPGSNQGIKPH